MRNKKILGLIALIVLILFVNVGFAATGTYNAANYQNYGYKYNCFMFVRQVLLNERAQDSSVGYFNSYTTDYLHFYDYIGGTLIAEHINKVSGTPSESAIKTAFQKAQVGDVVQMYWKWGSRSATQHTALIADIGDDYVEFLESNNPAGQIANHYYSYGGNSSKSIWGNLQTLYSNPGNSGGFSIYRFHYSVTTPEITDAPNGASPVAGGNFSYQCKANGNVTTWGISPGVIPSGMESYSSTSLPPGLSINPSTGLISGTVEHTSKGKNVFPQLRYYFNVTATNSGGTSQKSCYMSVWEPPVITTSSTLPEAKVGRSYSATITTEGTAFSMGYSVEGSLPPGLTLKVEGNGDQKRIATISGTPTKAGVYSFTLSRGNVGGTTSKEFTINVGNFVKREDPSLKLLFTFKNGKVGEYYRDYVVLRTTNYSCISAGSGTNRPSQWGLSMTISKSGGYTYLYLSGAPTRVGIFPFHIGVTREDGSYYTTNFTVTVASGTSPMSILYTLKKGKRGISYLDYVKVTGGAAPYTASIINGRLPYGLSLLQRGALTYLTGTPTRNNDNQTFTLRVKDSNGSYADKVLTVLIDANTSYRSGAADDSAVKPSISSRTLPNAAVGNEWEATLAAYGTQPITWFEGAKKLPEGLNIESDTGRISGIPIKAGKHKFHIKAENAIGSTIKKFKLKVVGEKPSILTRSLPNAVLKMPYEVPIEFTGTTPLKLKKVGKLPAGLKLNKKEKKIEGTPTKAGTYNFSLKLKNKSGTDIVQYALVVKDKEEEKTENATTSSVQAAVISEVDALLENDTIDDSLMYTALYMLSDDEKIEGSIMKEAGATNFVIDEWIDKQGRNVEVSDIKIFVNDELIEGVIVSDDGTFTLSKDVMSDDTTVYASAQTQYGEIKTSEVNIIATAKTNNNQNNLGNSGAGCEITSGITAMLFAVFTFLKKKNA